MARVEARLLALLLVGLLSWFALVPETASAQPLVEPGRVTTIDQARRCSPGGLHDAMPGPECKWKSVTLPHLVPASRANALDDAWFTVTFRLDAVPAEGLAMYLNSFSRTGRVFVNSTPLRAIGAMAEPLPQNWNRSQFLILPASMLRDFEAGLAAGR